jgi:hypothetical protein
MSNPIKSTPSVLLLRAAANAELLKAFNAVVASDFAVEDRAHFLSVGNLLKDLGLISHADATEWAKEFLREEKIAAQSGRMRGVIFREKGGAA